MTNISILIFAFFIIPSISLKLLSIKDVEETEYFNITIKDTPWLKNAKISFYWWVKLFRFGSHTYLGDDQDKRSIYIKGYSENGRSLWVNNIWEMSFPGKLQIIPHIWLFFCINLDNNEKTMEVYLNSIRIGKKEMPIEFDKVD